MSDWIILNTDKGLVTVRTAAIVMFRLAHPEAIPGKPRGSFVSFADGAVDLYVNETPEQISRLIGA